MKQIIPFCKDIVFKTNIAMINSISLDHKENIVDGEVCGEFIVYGDYKVHNDTTELIDFNYKLPFNAFLGANVIEDSVVLDIDNFTFDIIEEDVLRVNIDFFVEASYEDKEDTEELLQNIDREIDDILGLDDIEVLKDDVVDEKEKIEVIEEIDEVAFEEILPEVTVDEKVIVEEKKDIKLEEEIEQINDEYVTYHVHVVNENESIEQILKIYNVSLELLKEYNVFTDIKIGDKLVIPEYSEQE